MATYKRYFCYACTATGLVLKSQNNGVTWFPYQVGTDLRCIDFLDYQKGVTANVDGKVYLTNDGERYIELTDLGVQINDIKYVNINTIIAAGVNYIFKISFGEDYLGARDMLTKSFTVTVTEATLSVQETFNKISIKDSNSMYVSGDNGTIMKSIDGGISWSNIIVSDVYDYKGIEVVSQTEFLVTNNEAKIYKVTMDDIFYEPIPLSKLL